MELQNKPTEHKEIVHQKNEIIINQVRRIKLLEDKLEEVRHKYFSLKRYISFQRSVK